LQPRYWPRLSPARLVRHGLGARRHWPHHRALSRLGRRRQPLHFERSQGLARFAQGWRRAPGRGNNHLSGIIKYLTQSTWSHAALYVGPVAGAKTRDGEPHVLIEANIGEGVVSAPLSKYFRYHTRICRPIGLTELDCDKVCRYAMDRIGLAYDLKNIIDLLRYLFPLPVLRRWRRRLIALGSGDPSRIICSALIAQAFESVYYPIMPGITWVESESVQRELLEIRHSSLYAPRDFDISPYFEVLKPTIATGFGSRWMGWADRPHAQSITSEPSVPRIDESSASSQWSAAAMH
jgi:hypothetical protein